MSFPLLRLPLLASINVIKNVDVGDFVPLIRTSTRMKNLVKYSRVQIELMVVADNHIEFKKLFDPRKTKKVQIFLPPRSTEKKPNFPFDPFVRRSSTRVFECETNLEGYRKLMDDFVGIFLVRSVDFNLKYVNVSEVCVQYLEYAVSLGLKIKNVSMSVAEKYRVKDTRKLLSACAHISSLTASFPYPPT